MGDPQEEDVREETCVDKYGERIVALYAGDRKRYDVAVLSVLLSVSNSFVSFKLCWTIWQMEPTPTPSNMLECLSGLPTE